MSENSAIGWTTHSFNCWWGCVKVSPGCQNCYAETFSKRTGHNIWGPAATTPRRLFGDKHWQEPLKWDRAAEAAGERHRVFCASMADVFEEHPDVWNERNRLWDLISETPNLDWLLLTKRPENVMGMVPMDWTQYGFPPNVWMGTSTEDQQRADERIPHLLRVPAAVRFLSMEPLLGPVNLEPWTVYYDSVHGEPLAPRDDLHWTIIGGESGPKHRPMDLDWLAVIVEQCQMADVPVYVKQDSGLYPGRQGRIPDDLYLHEFPVSPAAAALVAP